VDDAFFAKLAPVAMGPCESVWSREIGWMESV
jgi:hypothetical protein